MSETGNRFARPSRPFRDERGVLVIAHRGGSGLWPENTLPAFEGARDLGVDVLELDIHATSDGALVVIHDAVVDRVTDGSGLVREKTLTELKALDAGYRWTDDGETFPFRGKGVSIPTLAEVIEAAPNHWINIDIKQADPPIIERLATLIDKNDLSERVLVGSFDPKVLSAFRTRCPAPATAAGLDEAKRFFVLHKLFLSRLYRPRAEVALQIPVDHEGRKIVTPRLIRDAHRRGLAVHAWTVNEEAEMHSLIEAGVDGIVTDRPDRLTTIRNERVG